MSSNVIARTVAQQPALCPRCQKGIRPGQPIALVIDKWVHEECT